jgi:DNA-binding Lrp family transcriptional regulator
MSMVRAYVLISASPGKAIDVATRLAGQEGIIQADAITGEYDVIAQVQADDVAGVGSLIVEKIQRVDGVFKTVTCLAVQ